MSNSKTIAITVQDILREVYPKAAILSEDSLAGDYGYALDSVDALYRGERRDLAMASLDESIGYYAKKKIPPSNAMIGFILSLYAITSHAAWDKDQARPWFVKRCLDVMKWHRDSVSEEDLKQAAAQLRAPVLSRSLEQAGQEIAGTQDSNLRHSSAAFDIISLLPVKNVSAYADRHMSTGYIVPRSVFFAMLYGWDDQSCTTMLDYPNYDIFKDDGTLSFLSSLSESNRNLAIKAMIGNLIKPAHKTSAFIRQNQLLSCSESEIEGFFREIIKVQGASFSGQELPLEHPPLQSLPLGHLAKLYSIQSGDKMQALKDLLKSVAETSTGMTELTTLCRTQSDLSGVIDAVNGAKKMQDASFAKVSTDIARPDPSAMPEIIPTHDAKESRMEACLKRLNKYPSEFVESYQRKFQSAIHEIGARNRKALNCFYDLCAAIPPECQDLSGMAEVAQSDVGDSLVIYLHKHPYVATDHSNYMITAAERLSETKVYELERLFVDNRETSLFKYSVSDEIKQRISICMEAVIPVAPERIEPQLEHYSFK